MRHSTYYVEKIEKRFALIELVRTAREYKPYA